MAYHRQIAAIVMAGILALAASGSWAQKKAKDPKPPLAGQPMPELPIPVSDQIDNAIGEMLAAFQVGDAELMHKHYAENATFVSGVYEPPINGWQNYAVVYQRQRAAFQGMQIVRRNTTIFPHGDVAWASYQWEFLALYNDKPYSAKGQTTLVLNKINNVWMIVHNHTSQICDTRAAASPQQTAGQTYPSNSAAPSPQPTKP